MWLVEQCENQHFGRPLTWLLYELMLSPICTWNWWLLSNDSTKWTNRGSMHSESFIVLDKVLSGPWTLLLLLQSSCFASSRSLHTATTWSQVCALVSAECFVNDHWDLAHICIRMCMNRMHLACWRIQIHGIARLAISLLLYNENQSAWHLIVLF